MPWIAFEHPYALLLAPVAITLVLLLTLHPNAHTRRPRLAAAIRIVVALCVVLCLSAPSVRQPGQLISRVYLVDASASAAGTMARALAVVRESLHDLKPNDTAAVVLFAAAPAVEVPPTEVRRFKLADQPLSSVNAGATDLTAALRVGRDQFDRDRGRQLVVLWDGNQAVGGALAEASRLAADGVQLAVVGLDVGPIVDARIERVRAPQRVRIGQTAQIEVLAAATVATSAKVQLTCNGQPCGPPQAVRIDPHLPGRVLFTTDLNEGWCEVEARIIEPEDAFPQNDSASAFIRVGSRSSVALASSALDPWLGRLLGPNTNLDVSILGPSHLPGLTTGLDRVDCVVLDNLPDQQLGSTFSAGLAGYVRNGGGLVVVGGRQAFGPGGYAGSQIEKLLPVRCDPRRERGKPVAVAVVLDKSGSMNDTVAGRAKIDYARLGVLRVVDELKTDDAMALIAFDSAAQTLIPLGPVVDSDAVKGVVSRIFAKGQTNLNPALDTAYTTLKDRPPGTSHILLLSDGLSAEPVDAAGQIERLNRAGITLSAVATGADADRATLSRLAGETGGRFYSAEDIRRLPEILSSDIRLHTQDLVVEGDFRADIVRPTGPLTGIEQLPELTGYVLTAARDEATVHCIVGQERDALLASWNVGLGRVVAFTSTAGGPWDGSWQIWGQVGQFWNQVLRQAARPVDSDALKLDLTHEGGFIRVSARLASDIASIPDALRARAVLPSGEEVQLPLGRRGVRRFDARLDAPEQGTYAIQVAAADRPELTGTGRLHVGYSPEWRALGLNEDGLRDLARAAGGEVVTDLSQWSRDDASGWRMVAVGWLLLLAAAGAFLIDLAVT